MILTSTAAASALRYTPDWLSPEVTAPVFLIRAGNVLEREQMEAELAGEHLAGTVWPWEIQEAIVAGLRELGGESAEELILLAETVHSGEPLSVSDQAVLTEALELLAQHWPPYKQLVAQTQRRQQMIPIVAFRRFCIGWENVDAPYKRGRDKLVDLGALSGIDPFILRMAGAFAWRMQFGGAERKNSDALSKSDAAPATSNSGAAIPEVGKSPETMAVTTPKTPD